MDFEFEQNQEIEEAEFETKVPSDFRGFYAKGSDGKFKLAEGVAQTAAKLIDGLGKNLKTARTTNSSVALESKTRREALEAWASTMGVDTPEAAKAVLDELNAKLASGSKIKPEEVRAAIEQEFSNKFKAKDEENAALLGTLSEHLIDNSAITALAEHGGNQKLLLPLIRQQTKMVKDDETGRYFAAVVKADGTIRAGADGGPMPVSKLVEEMKADKDLASAFTGTKQSGTGTDPKKVNGGQQQQQRQAPEQKEVRGVGKISAHYAGA